MKATATPDFAALLRRHRRERGFTQEELAARAGLSVGAISYLERGLTQVPHKDTIQLLAQALDLSADDAAALGEMVRGARGDGTAPINLERHPAPSEGGRLPGVLTPLIGRERETKILLDLLTRESVRLLTLTGPAGVGKTRLAIHTARMARDTHAGEVAFVDLIPIQRPDGVIAAIAQALGVRDHSKLPLNERLVAALADRHLMVVLDNFEQVLPAARDVIHLLGACPQVKALVTSREALRVRGEQEFAVHPLDVPDSRHVANLEEVERFGAVALFVARANEAQHDFAITTAEQAGLVVSICAQLDGLPLAIELAAARVRHFSLRDMRDRLTGQAALSLLAGGAQDLAHHQRTMRSAIDWSYQQLSPDEQHLFRVLGVFAAGATADAAEAVSRLAEESVLACLASLVDKSVARWADACGAARYSLLMTLQVYALERLRESGELEVLQQRFADYYLQLVELAEPGLIRQEIGVIERLASESENLRAVLRWAVERREVVYGLRMAGALWRFWLTRGLLSEGRAWLDRLLALDAGAARTAGGEQARSHKPDSSAHQDPDQLLVRARALYGAGTLAVEQGDYERAAALGEESLRLCAADQAKARVQALNLLAIVAKYRGNFEQADMLYAECLALQRALDDARGIAVALNNLGAVATERGQYERAREHFEESLAIKRSLGDTRGVAVTLLNLADVARDCGQYARANAALEESLEFFKRLGDKRGIALSLNNLAEVARAQGDFASARRYSLDSLTLSTEIGDKWAAALTFHNLGDIARDRADNIEAAARYHESLALYAEARNALGVAECLEGLVVLAHVQDAPARAVQLWGAAQALRDAAAAPMPPSDRDMYERTIADVRGRLGTEAFAAAFALGHALSLEEAIALAGQRPPGPQR
jgi:predicted ATPase/DNA-binding XRE family transcriptional regulator/predicted negative regulator of RcsB-dependent stress response